MCDVGTQADLSGDDRMDGSFDAETSWEDSQLSRVLRGEPMLLMLDKLPDDDKARLAATCWGALETVLRDTRAVLRVRPDDSVLAGVAARVTEGPCAGSVTVCGVQVAATDAGALLAATEDVGLPVDYDGVDYRDGVGYRRSIEDSYQIMRDWVLMVMVAAESGADVRVTGLTVPTIDDRLALEGFNYEAREVAQVLQTSMVRDSLRSLKLRVGGRVLDDEVIEVLHGALRGLSALQHLELRNPYPSWVCLVDQYSNLKTLKLRQIFEPPGFGLGEWEAFFDAVERATGLRSLMVEVGVGERAESAALRPRGLPAGLEELYVSITHPVRWWEATNLRSLTLRHLTPEGLLLGPPVWARLAELLGRCRTLRRLVIDDLTEYLNEGDVLAVLAALERSRVEELAISFPIASPTSEESTEALTAALASVLRNAALRDLTISETKYTAVLGFDGFAAPVFTALRDSTALRTLRVHWRGSTSPGLGEALGALLSSSTSLVELEVSSLDWRSPDTMDPFWRGLGENRTLEVLRLDDMRAYVMLEDEDLSLLLRALYVDGRDEGRQLHTLEICGTSVSDRGVEYIAALLRDQRSSRLRRVALTEVGAGDKGVEVFARALRRNSTLKSLELDARHATAVALESLAAALAENTTLQHVDIHTSGADMHISTLKLVR
ncbi:unnamed protein product [Pedinophyceae sp. YPF-701]|nr:unnamed protein product [Pedinophyceae sp. YPF-701]